MAGTTAATRVDVASSEEQLAVAVDRTLPSEELGVVMFNERLLVDLRRFQTPPAGPGAASVADAAAFPSRVVDAEPRSFLDDLHLFPAGNADNLFLDNFNDVCGELRSLAAVCGAGAGAGRRATVVDLTARSLRAHDLARYEELAKSGGVNVVLGTGLGGRATAPEWARQAATKAEVARELRLQLTRGAAETKWLRWRAGIIGAVDVGGGGRASSGGDTVDIDLSASSASASASSPPLVLDALEEKLLRGAALAQAETGAPLAVRLQHWRRDAGAVLDVLAEEGCALERVILVDVDVLSDDVTLLASQLLPRGVRVCLSGLGSPLHTTAATPCNGAVGWESESDEPRLSPSDWESARVVRDLCRLKRGFAKQLVVSTGVWCKAMLSRHGGHGHKHAVRSFRPLLKRVGVDDADLDRIFSGNAARLLAWWVPPPPVEAEGVPWRCDNCAKSFAESHQRFTKFKFQYCSMKCLIANKKVWSASAPSV